MKKEQERLQDRLDRVKEVYYGLRDLIKHLPDDVPDEVKDILQKAILGDKELKKLMEGLDTYRVPRFLMVGRTGVGKSSLINALCNCYTAKVSDVQIGTKSSEKYECKCGDRTILEIFDSRGIGESENYKESETAESQLKEDIVKFRPDVILFVLRCKERSRIQNDIKAVKELKAHYKKKTDLDIPIIVVLNQADEMSPPDRKDPNDYPHTKLDNIENAEREVKRLLVENHLEYEDIIAVSSYINWGSTPEEMKDWTKKQLEEVTIVKDYRYNIENLMKSLEECLETDASMGFLMAADVNEVLNRITKRIIAIFKNVAAVIAATPLPLADIVILTALQVLMVAIIAYISGEHISSKEQAIKVAIKFIKSVLGIGVIGKLFQLTAGQLSKLVPGAGTLVNAAIAREGTSVMGKMAIEYYINGKSMNVIKKEYKQYKKEMKMEEK